MNTDGHGCETRGKRQTDAVVRYCFFRYRVNPCSSVVPNAVLPLSLPRNPVLPRPAAWQACLRVSVVRKPLALGAGLQLGAAAVQCRLLPVRALRALNPLALQFTLLHLSSLTIGTKEDRRTGVAAPAQPGSVSRPEVGHGRSCRGISATRGPSAPRNSCLWHHIYREAQ